MLHVKRCFDLLILKKHNFLSLKRLLHYRIQDIGVSLTALCEQVSGQRGDFESEAGGKGACGRVGGGLYVKSRACPCMCCPMSICDWHNTVRPHSPSGMWDFQVENSFCRVVGAGGRRQPAQGARGQEEGKRQGISMG